MELTRDPGSLLRNRSRSLFLAFPFGALRPFFEPLQGLATLIDLSAENKRDCSGQEREAHVVEAHRVDRQSTEEGEPCDEQCDRPAEAQRSLAIQLAADRVDAEDQAGCGQRGRVVHGPIDHESAEDHEQDRPRIAPAEHQRKCLDTDEDAGPGVGFA